MDLVTNESFPHGVRCGVCQQIIPTGAPYMTSPHSMTADAIPVETIRCVDCNPI